MQTLLSRKTKNMFRISLFLIALFAITSCSNSNNQSADHSEKTTTKPQRIIIVMFDGFGSTYYHSTQLPFLNRVEKDGFYKEVSALMPTVTNCNNTAICTGEFPEVNGITGNTYLKSDGTEDYMEDKSLIKSPTLFEKLKKFGVKSALIASKKKSVGLLPTGTDLALSPETASEEWIKRIGKPDSIYSPEVNYWTFDAALYLLKNQKDFGCLYIHTTDYPMHMWAPEDPRSLKHVRTIDSYLAKIHQIAPDAIIMVTADHDVKHKNLCVDLRKSLKLQQVSIKTAISAEKDKYVKHHRGFGGTSYVYLNNPADSKKVTAALKKIRGVKTVLTRAEAVKIYHLMGERIGDLVVFANEMTVFGDLETPNEALPETYRSHGSEYELKVPVFIYNAHQLPPASFFNYNKDIARWLFLKQYSPTFSKSSKSKNRDPKSN